MFCIGSAHISDKSWARKRNLPEMKVLSMQIHKFKLSCSFMSQNSDSGSTLSKATSPTQKTTNHDYSLILCLLSPKTIHFPVKQ